MTLVPYTDFSDEAIHKRVNYCVACHLLGDPSIVQILELCLALPTHPG